MSRPTLPLGEQRADEAAASILPVLPWPSGVSRPTSPLGVATVEAGTAIQFATGTTGTAIQFATGTISQFVSSLSQFVSSHLQIDRYILLQLSNLNPRNIIGGAFHSFCCNLNNSSSRNIIGCAFQFRADCGRRSRRWCQRTPLLQMLNRPWGVNEPQWPCWRGVEQRELRGPIRGLVRGALGG